MSKSSNVIKHGGQALLQHEDHLDSFHQCLLVASLLEFHPPPTVQKQASEVSGGFSSFVLRRECKWLFVFSYGPAINWPLAQVAALPPSDTAGIGSSRPWSKPECRRSADRCE